jgi:hypothetical protein
MPSKARLSVVLPLALALSGGCATGRGPVDRSVDAFHETNRTVGESAQNVTESTGNVVVDAVTFPFRLIGRVFGALAG